MSERLPYLTPRLQGLGVTVFAEMTRLAREHDAVNLGQGYPDFAPDARVTDGAVAAIRAGHNQYAPGDGIPALRAAIAEHQRRFWDLDWDPDGEITVAAGATEAVVAALLALTGTGDEVVLFEPFYDAYLAGTLMAGATPKAVTLRPPGFTFDPEDLRAAITPRTRVLVLNSPHNPTGKVFSQAELETIAHAAVEHDLIVVTDEVYEHLVYEGAHVPIASLPGMRDRTVQISSAGKTFAVTGWKIGWICAQNPLTRAVRTAKQFLTFTNGTPFQHAIAAALGFEGAFFDEQAQVLRGRRDRLVAGLTDAGFAPLQGQGSYYVMVDVAALGHGDDVEFCRTLPAKAGVAAVPCSGFYLEPRRGRGLVRFAFCKTDPVLDEGVARLRAFGGAQEG
jgi:N-succinyldiaminopimelate aminotransferase